MWVAQLTPEMAEPTQGPEWLGEFLQSPPFWFRAALFALGALVLVLVAWSVIRRDWYISPDEQESIALILATVDGVALGTIVSMWLLPLGYLGDVVVGLVVGLAGVDAVARVARRVAPHIKREIGLMAMWGVLVVAPIGIVVGAELAGATTPPGLSYGGAMAAVIFGMWSLAQEFTQGETLGEAFRAEMDSLDSE